jgi:hypothetical protein
LCLGLSCECRRKQENNTNPQLKSGLVLYIFL